MSNTPSSKLRTSYSRSNRNIKTINSSGFTITWNKQCPINF